MWQDLDSAQMMAKSLKAGDQKAKSGEWEGRDQLVLQLRDLKKSRRHVISIDPMDPDYRRMRFARYADDFVIGIAGSKADAEILKAKVEQFLRQELLLELSKEKTLITHLEKKIRFLGYDFSRWNQQRVVRVKYKTHQHPLMKRTLGGAIKLEIPRQKLSDYATKQGYGSLDALQKSKHRAKLLNNSDLEILTTYNAELRGIANYYQLANNYHHLDHLFHLAKYSFLRTVANKHKSSVKKMSRVYGRYLQGEICVPFKDKQNRQRLRKLVLLKHLPKGRIRKSEVDVIPNTLKYSGDTELEERLKANTCEACGTTTGVMEVHHVRKLKDVRRKRNKTRLDQVMISRKRKTLVLCYKCHHLHHERQVPIEQLESLVK